MKRMLFRGVVLGIIALTGTGVSLAQQGAPRGYVFFAPRNRPSPAARARAEQTAATRSKKHQIGPCCGAFDEPASNSPVTIAAADRAEPIPVRADPQKPDTQLVDWGGREFGLNYGWPEEGYYPGAPAYGFGRAPAFPMHGYRATYEWAGHTYSMHCYCAEGYCPFHCPGYRGECYVPCWNDAGTPIFERRCGRGSCWDCFWHMGGYECPRRKTDCPYVCGTPSYLSSGFPRGRAGDPNHRAVRGATNGTPPERTGDDYPPSPNTRPMPIPLDVREVPKEPGRTAEPPVPNPPE